MKQAPFVGRQREIAGLKRLLNKKVASLVTVQGRRRIGKSRLIEEFVQQSNRTFYRFSGLPPQKGITAQHQRDEFARALNEQFGFKALSSFDWGDLFTFLASQIKDQEVIILFDEISWMALGDQTFLGKLKNAWDTHFNKNPKLILVLCGSVSAWIENHILRNTGYVGRISHSLCLDELSLLDCNLFFSNFGLCYSAWEKFLVLAVTGGVPRYLEELDQHLTAQEGILQLCFQPEGLLFREFDSIFSNLFPKKSDNYRKIILALKDRNLSYSEICEALHVEKSSNIIENLDDLVKSGFLSRDYTWNISSTKESKLSHYRIKDNYTRFYLKYIQPNMERIKKGHFNNYLLSSLPGWSSSMGFQFENLILLNRQWILEKLHLRVEDVLNDNPYFQRKTQKQAGCQVDYLVQTRFNTFFVCEIKFSRHPISARVVQEVEEKISRLKVPKRYLCNPVLIHVNGVSDSVEDAQFFTHIIDIKSVL